MHPDEGKIAFANSMLAARFPSNPFSKSSMNERKDYQKTYRQTYKDQARRVNLTFSLPEVSGLEAAAKSSGVPLAQLVKKLALQAFEQKAGTAVPKEVEERLADLDRLVRNIANNVNQMARHSNRIEFVLDEQEVFLHLRSLEKELHKTIAGLVNLGENE